MAQIEVLLPKMGESVAEATIIKWLKNEGDAIEADEPIIEIATDKVDSEVPAPNAGILAKKLCADGDVVAVGQPIAIISSEKVAAAPASVPTVTTAAAPVSAAASNGASDHAAEPQTAAPIHTGQGSRFYSPLVRNIAQAEGIGISELETIPGSGAEGRVTKKDILNYIPSRSAAKTAALAIQAQPANEAPAVPAPKPAAQPAVSVSNQVKGPQIIVGADDEIMEMDRMRKIIAEHMVMSKHVSPHVTSYVEADVTNIVEWRNKWKDKFEAREGEKLTFTPVFIEVLAKAIKEMPMVNVSTDGTNIIKRKHINIGMAAALPSGNLIVPVIKDADQLNLYGVTKRVNDLAKRARLNKLQPDEIQGGTYTLTNVGTFGNVMGTPIINQPQAAIMAVGAIRKKPAVIETPQGDFIGIRHMMFLSHSYDHRIIDGALGGRFVRRVADLLEQFDATREI